MVLKSVIEERMPRDVSIMAKGVLNKLTREEIFDLLAYVLGGGSWRCMDKPASFSPAKIVSNKRRRRSPGLITLEKKILNGMFGPNLTA